MESESVVIHGCRTLESLANGVDTDILIRGGKIVDIGDIDIEDASVLKASGLLALPGLIDCHVHLVLDGSPDIVGYAASCNADFFHAKALENAERTLLSGFTHLRDMGCFAFSVSGSKHSFPTGISAAGHMLMAPSGHVRKIGRVVRSLGDAADAVDEQLEGGANFIKAIASGGLLTPGTTPQSSEMGRDTLDAIAAQARKNNLPLAVHAYGDSDVTNAIRAGAASIEHGYWAGDVALRDAVSKGTCFVPTLKALWCILDNSDQLPGHVVKNAESAHAAAERMVRSAVREGVTLLLGTDSGTPFNLHGDNAMELVYMNELGVSEDVCLAAGTSSAAAFLGLGDAVGRIKSGCVGDIILVKGDPLADLKTIYKGPKVVLKSGKVISDDAAIQRG